VPAAPERAAARPRRRRAAERGERQPATDHQGEDVDRAGAQRDADHQETEGRRGAQRAQTPAEVSTEAGEQCDGRVESTIR